MQTPVGLCGVLESREDALVLVEMLLLDLDVDLGRCPPAIQCSLRRIQMSVCVFHLVS